MKPVTIHSDAPDSVIVINQSIIEQYEQLLADERAIVIRDAFDLECANTVYVGLNRLEKEIDEQRLKATSPFRSVVDSINNAAKPIAELIKAARASIGKRMLDAKTEMERKQREAEAAAKKAQQEAEEAARKAQEAEAVASKQEADGDAELFCLPAPAVVVVPPAPVPAPVPVPVAVPLPKLAVRASNRKVLSITDEAKIPREINGIKLLVPDTKAIKKALELGLVIPGAELVAETGTAAMPTR